VWAHRALNTPQNGGFSGRWLDVGEEKPTRSWQWLRFCDGINDGGEARAAAGVRLMQHIRAPRPARELAAASAPAAALQLAWLD
jgi:hypothetical protein